MLDSTSRHLERQRLLSRRALLSARRLRFDNLDALTSLVTGFQALAASEADTSIRQMMAEQSIDSDPVATLAPTAFAGSANDGRPLRSLLEFSRSNEVSPSKFDLIILGQVRDAARQASSVSMFVEPRVTVYVRALTAPSCSRCAILAGGRYRAETPFQRHPRCDCRHVPSTEKNAKDLVTDPAAYFDSLDAAEQDRIFTKAGAQAIRDGADMSRVVNARRGMSTAQSGRPARRDVSGQMVFTTTEARKSLGVRTDGRGRPYVRLMPESIYEIADDRDHALRLLKVHGYIT